MPYSSLPRHLHFWPEAVRRQLMPLDRLEIVWDITLVIEGTVVGTRRGRAGGGGGGHLEAHDASQVRLRVLMVQDVEAEVVVQRVVLGVLRPTQPLPRLTAQTGGSHSITQL